LVGRAHELDLLLERWQLARTGATQVVILLGEGGIGKSRLAEALRERLGDEPHAHCLYQCSPHHVGSALHLIVEQLEQVAGFRRVDSREERLDKLECMLARRGEDLPASAQLFSALLSLLTRERYRYLDLTPQR
jgi:predicted ATPase